MFSEPFFHAPRCLIPFAVRLKMNFKFQLKAQSWTRKERRAESASITTRKYGEGGGRKEFKSFKSLSDRNAPLEDTNLNGNSASSHLMQPDAILFMNIGISLPPPQKLICLRQRKNSNQKFHLSRELDEKPLSDAFKSICSAGKVFRKHSSSLEYCIARSAWNGRRLTPRVIPRPFKITNNRISRTSPPRQFSFPSNFIIRT